MFFARFINRIKKFVIEPTLVLVLRNATSQSWTSVPRNLMETLVSYKTAGSLDCLEPQAGAELKNWSKIRFNPNMQYVLLNEKMVA